MCACLLTHIVVHAGYNQGGSTPPSDHSHSNDTDNNRSDSPPAFLSQPHDDNDNDNGLEDHGLDDEGPAQSRKIEPKKGGYDSRIEQILYEHPDLDVQIVHAGKNTEGGGSYITYTIRTGVSQRYPDPNP